MYFRAAPFDAAGASLFFRDATVFHGKGGVIRAGGIPVPVEAHFFEGAFITRIVRDQSFLKVEIVLEETVNTGGIKSGVP